MGAYELDTAAVQQDAATVHALATRAFDDVDLQDPAVAALAAWVAEIDAGIDETTPFVLSTPLSGSSTVVMPSARGRRSVLIAGSTVFALVVSGGAAAAVTGDPLAIVRAPLHTMERFNPFADSEANARDRLPQQAPTTASANKLLADAQRAMVDGDTAKAQDLLAEAEALLGENANPGQLKRIDKLKGDLPGKSGSQPQPNQGPKGPGDPQGKGPGDPQGKGPVDKPGQGPKGSNDPNGKGSKGEETTQPSGGSTKGGSGQPPTDDTSNKDSGTGSGDPGKQGSDTADGAGSTKPAQSPKSSPKG